MTPKMDTRTPPMNLPHSDRHRYSLILRVPPIVCKITNQGLLSMVHKMVHKLRIHTPHAYCAKHIRQFAGFKIFDDFTRGIPTRNAGDPTPRMRAGATHIQA